jgi:hypothetical protein
MRLNTQFDVMGHIFALQSMLQCPAEKFFVCKSYIENETGFLSSCMPWGFKILTIKIQMLRKHFEW